MKIRNEENCRFSYTGRSDGSSAALNCVKYGGGHCAFTDECDPLFIVTEEADRLELRSLEGRVYLILSSTSPLREEDAFDPKERERRVNFVIDIDTMPYVWFERLVKEDGALVSFSDGIGHPKSCISVAPDDGCDCADIRACRCRADDILKDRAEPGRYSVVIDRVLYGLDGYPQLREKLRNIRFKVNYSDVCKTCAVKNKENCDECPVHKSILNVNTETAFEHTVLVETDATVPKEGLRRLIAEARTGEEWDVHCKEEYWYNARFFFQKNVIRWGQFLSEDLTGPGPVCASGGQEPDTENGTNPE